MPDDPEVPGDSDWPPPPSLKGWKCARPLQDAGKYLSRRPPQLPTIARSAMSATPVPTTIMLMPRRPSGLVTSKAPRAWDLRRVTPVHPSRRRRPVRRRPRDQRHEEMLVEAAVGSWHGDLPEHRLIVSVGARPPAALSHDDVNASPVRCQPGTGRPRLSRPAGGRVHSPATNRIHKPCASGGGTRRLVALTSFTPTVRPTMGRPRTS